MITGLWMREQPILGSAASICEHKPKRRPSTGGAPVVCKGPDNPLVVFAPGVFTGTAIYVPILNMIEATNR
jgi:hypothetical protein